MPDYALLTPHDIETGVDHAIARTETVVEGLVHVSGERSFENTLRPLDRIGDILAHAFCDFCFMGYVHTDKDVRSAAKAAEEKVDKWASDLFFRDELYEAVQEYAATEEAGSLEGEEERFLEFVQRDLRRAGHELDPATRRRVQQLTQRVIELGVRFQQNIDEWDGYVLASREDLEGMPDSWIDNLEIDEETNKYKVTIDYPDLIPFLENSPRRDLREKLRYEFNTVAIEENRKILEEALDIRQEIAEAFGESTWAHHRLEDRMAKTPERVEEFYAGLAEGLKARGEAEVAEISKLLEADTGDAVVESWDWSYYDTQQRKADYGVDNFEVAKYFPLPQVLEGMFELTSEMFGI
ncbi:MAG TPA: M3 family metallopeptidase, partial [Acidimicrobiia bacterium]